MRQIDWVGANGRSPLQMIDVLQRLFELVLYQFYMRLRSIRVAAIHELPLQCVVLHQSYKAHLQTEMVLEVQNLI